MLRKVCQGERSGIKSVNGTEVQGARGGVGWGGGGEKPATSGGKQGGVSLRTFVAPSGAGTLTFPGPY